jgi:Tol biopolymer transport system component
MPLGPGIKGTLGAVAALTLALGASAASYPPRFHFQTVRSERVAVHFHEGYEALARRAVAMATEILEAHEARYGRRVGPVQIVLIDAEDEPNGFSTPFPYPLVTIRAAAPDGTGSLGNHDGWLRLVLTHELTHTVHLEEARGLWGFARRLFGRAPYLFPNVLAMPWMIEGLATYEETEGTAFGRGRSPQSRMVLRMAALEDRFPSEDQAIYGLDEWPGGQAPYLFGEGFLRDLARQHGADTLPRLSRQHAGQIVPFLEDRTARKVTGSDVHGQWKGWAARARAAFDEEAAEREAAGLTPTQSRTERGIRQVGPRFSPDGSWIAYTSGTLTRFPEIRLMRSDGSGDRGLALRNGGSGLSWTPDGRFLVYSEPQIHHTFETHYDLQRVDVASGQVERLTRGLRALDPDVSPDGRAIVFSRRLGDRSELWRMGFDGQGLQAITRSEAGTEWSGPRWSPAGSSIVAARLQPGGWLDIVLVDARTGEVRPVTRDRATDVEPTFAPDGDDVVFRSDRDGIPNLYAAPVAGGGLARVTNVLGGAFEPSVSPDGGGVVFAAYSSRGYDLQVAELDLSRAAPAPAFVDPYGLTPAEPTPAAGPARPYRPLSLLLPRFWTPLVSLAEEQDLFGVGSGGADPLLRHAWGAQALYGTKTERVDWSAFYAYDRWRPTLLAVAEDKTEISGPDELRTRTLDLQLALPLRRTLRSSQALSLTWRRERQEVLGAGPDETLDLGGLQLAWTLSSARQYPFSISPVDGGRLRLAWLREDDSLGSDVSLDKLTADARYYLRVFGERDVLAVRLGGGLTQGEPGFMRSYAVGGYPDASLFDVVRTNPAVLRGYPDNAFTGRSFVALNAEYRVPLGSPQRGWRSLPVFLRHLRGTLFFDAAHAWTGDFRLEEMKTAVGASLGVDTAVAFAVPFTFELSVARGFQEKGDTKAYFRLGLAF